MVNGIILIPPDGEIYQKEGLLPGEHGKAILEYMRKNDITFSGCDEVVGYQLACYLASLNYVLDTVENKKHCFYVGDEIFLNQYQWFKENKKSIRTSILGVVSVCKEKIEHYDFYTMEEGNPFSALREIMNERKRENNYVRDVKN